MFVWSRSRTLLSSVFRDYLFLLLKKNCIQTIDQIVFSNSERSKCIINQNNDNKIITADLSLEIKNKQKNFFFKNSTLKIAIKDNEDKKNLNMEFKINKVNKLSNKINQSKIFSSSDFSVVDLQIKLNMINNSLNQLMIDKAYQNKSKQNDDTYSKKKNLQKVIYSEEKDLSSQEKLIFKNKIRYSQEPFSNFTSNFVKNSNISLKDDDIKRLKKDQKDLNEKGDLSDYRNLNQIKKFRNEFSASLNSNSSCPNIDCPITYCSFERKKNLNGCETCDCLKNPKVTCKIPFCHPCFYGSYTDVDGCGSCACKPRPKSNSIYECPKLDCPTCNYGSIKDEYGCESCICIRPNSPEIIFKCSSELNCPFGTCEHGSILDELGCPTCNCLKSNNIEADQCPKLRCTHNCMHGYFTDKNGCETCNCKPEWMSPCYTAKNHCVNDCEFGSYLDRNGCPSCECLPDPNLKISCPKFKTINPEIKCTSDGKYKPIQCNQHEYKKFDFFKFIILILN